MAFKYGCHTLLFLLHFIPLALGMTIVDDVNSSLVYSNSGPAWWGSNYYNGQGRYVGGHSHNQPNVIAYGFTWHEAMGDGASVSLKFTGTRVNLTGTICNTGWPTIVDFYIDGQYKTRFEHQPAVPLNHSISDTYLLYTMGDFGDLEPAEHTFKAVSVGDDTLFVVDFVAYEPSDAISTPSTSSNVSSATSRVSSFVSSMGTESSSSSTTKISSTSTKSSSSTSQYSRSTLSTTADGLDPVVAAMDVPASDPRIIYSPPGAWLSYSNTRRAASCLDGTMVSSTATSYLTYNFIGPTIQVYTVSSPIGGNYSISIDGENQGIYTSYDASGDPSTCLSKPAYSKIGLADTQHSLVLAVQHQASGSTQDTIQFVGFRRVSFRNVSS